MRGHKLEASLWPARRLVGNSIIGTQMSKFSGHEPGLGAHLNLMLHWALWLTLALHAINSWQANCLDIDLNEPADSWLADDGLPISQPAASTVRPAHWLGPLARWSSGSLRKLPDYFDFDRFSARFGRRSSGREHQERKARFLSRCLSVFRARVDFRLGKRHYLESVNKFADQSDEELSRLFMGQPPLEWRPANQSEAQYLKLAKLRGRLSGRFLVQDESDSQAAEGGGDSLMNEHKALEEIEAMIAESFDVRSRLALTEELAGAHQETLSQAAEGAGQPATRPLPWPGQRPRAAPLPAELSEPLAPGERLDWSQHPCFHRVYDQGTKCGKCYVMVATSLAEFYKCSEQTNVVDRRQFSKDFVLDCGQKFAPTLLGCGGGSIMDTIKFIATSGVHSIASWRQARRAKLDELYGPGRASRPPKGQEPRCPLNPFDTPLEEWGPVKVAIEPESVEVDGWLEALADGPLGVAIQMPSVGILSYAGGVHDGQGCAISGHWHSMLLVGYGISERGEPYWRLRNSWGDDWGDAGHLDLSMNLPAGCLVGGVRVNRSS